MYTRTRHVIRYRATANLQRPQLKQQTTTKEGVQNLRERHIRTYNDKAYTSPHLFGQFVKFRIFIKFFIHEVKKTSKI